MNGRLSVVVTCFNQGALIASMLGALLHDLHDDDEVIVVDDGSTDDSVTLIRNAAGDDTRVRVLPGTASQSVSRTRNRGMHAATGEWISFLDGDDEYCAGRRAHLTCGMRTFPQAHVLFTDYTLWEPHNVPPREARALEARLIHDELLRIAAATTVESNSIHATDWRSINDTALTLLLLQHGSMLHVCCLVVRRAWIEARALQFDARLVVAEDTDFAIHALQNAFVAFLPVVTARYRITNNGLSARDDTAARMSRFIQRINNLQLPAAAPATHGELSAWRQVAQAELNLAYQCRQDGYYHTAMRHALRSFVVIPRMLTLGEVLKSVWLIIKTKVSKFRAVPARENISSSASLTLTPKSSLSGEFTRVPNVADQPVVALTETRSTSATEVARSDHHAPV